METKSHITFRLFTIGSSRWMTWLQRHIHVIILGIVLILAAFIRVWAAANFHRGRMWPQFWAFAKVFQQHGLDFYRYADAQLDIFPMKGWAYVYPPIWLLISRVAFVFCTVQYRLSVWPVLSRCPRHGGWR